MVDLVPLLERHIKALRFPWTTWSNVAWKYHLVLQGYGRDIKTIPGLNWIGKMKGAVTQLQWERLARRIPLDYRGNPHHKVDDDTLHLRIITLDEFREQNPGMALDRLISCR